ncbi:MAG: hypothetical protein WC979_07295 [Candidatus Pacearchaeota archaeon]|jgi:hypothetical protein
MSEKDQVFKGKIKQTGIFSFKDFYSFTYDWLKDDGYDVVEKAYSETVSGDSKKVEIKWEATREISDYFKFQIKMDWLILGMKTIEVQKENKKIKMETAAVEIKFTAVLIKDYEDRWENHPFWKFMRGIYEKYIIKVRVDDYQIKLLSELEELINQCKAFLAIEAQH